MLLLLYSFSFGSFPSILLKGLVGLKLIALFLFKSEALSLNFAYPLMPAKRAGLIRNLLLDKGSRLQHILFCPS